MIFHFSHLNHRAHPFQMSMDENRTIFDLIPSYLKEAFVQEQLDLEGGASPTAAHRQSRSGERRPCRWCRWQRIWRRRIANYSNPIDLKKEVSCQLVGKYPPSQSVHQRCTDWWSLEAWRTYSKCQRWCLHKRVQYRSLSTWNHLHNNIHYKASVIDPSRSSLDLRESHPDREQCNGNVLNLAIHKC